MSAHIKKHSTAINFVFITLITILIALIFNKILGFSFSSNDDVTLKNIVSGKWTGRPDAHMIYSMYVYGFILKLLYTWFPSISWYEYILLSLHFICFGLIIFRISNCFNTFRKKIFSIFFSICVLMLIEMPYLSAQQYTVTAGMLASVGILWIATGRFCGIKKGDFALIIAVLTLSMWIRKEAFLMSLPLLILAFFFYISSFESNRLKNIRHILPAFCIFAGIVLFSFICETAAYSSSEWKDFREFNKYRTELYDYNLLPDYSGSADVYTSLGISEDDYCALKENDLLILKDLTTDDLKTLAARGEEIQKEWAQYYSVPRKIIYAACSAMYDSNSNFIGIAATVLFFIALTLSMVAKNKTAYVTTIATYIYLWIFVGYFANKGRLPERVLHPFCLMCIMIFTSVIIAYLVKYLADKPQNYLIRFSAVPLAIIFSAVLLIAEYREVKDTAGDFAITQQSCDELFNYFNSNNDNSYLVDTNLFATCGSDIPSAAEYPQNIIILENWTMHSPLETAREQNVLGENGVYDSLVKSENTYFVISDLLDQSWVEKIYREEYPECSLILTDSVQLSDGSMASVYRLEVN